MAVSKNAYFWRAWASRMGNCIFCTLYASGNVAIFEHKELKNYFYYWDIHPATPGHLLIIPKRHIVGFRDLTNDELKELGYAAKKAYEAIENTDLVQVYSKMLATFASDQAQTFLKHTIELLQKRNGKPDGYNHGLNDGEAAGRTVHHLHYHIMPRWKGDLENPQGGIRHMFTGMGNYQDGIKQ